MCGILSWVLPNEFRIRGKIYVCDINEGEREWHKILGIHELQNTVSQRFADLAHDSIPRHFDLENRWADGVWVSKDGQLIVFDSSWKPVAYREVGQLRAWVSNEILEQTRYRTTWPDADNYRATQPVTMRDGPLRLTLVHNGNSIWYEDIHRKHLWGDPSSDESDSHTIAGICFKKLQELQEATSFDDAISDTLKYLSDTISWAYLISFVVEGYFKWEYNKATVSFNSDSGIRPNAVWNDGRIVASESRALRKNGLDTWQYIRPGEALMHNHISDAVSTIDVCSSYGQHPCLLEAVYIMRNSSRFYGETETSGDKRHDIAIELWKYLQQAHPDVLDTDFIVGVPKWGDIFAQGVSAVTWIPVIQPLRKKKYAARSYIAAGISETERILLEKFDIDLDYLNIIKWQKIILTDDSIIKGSTMRRVLDILWRFAREVVVVSWSPKFRYEDGKWVLIPTKYLLSRNDSGGLRTHQEMQEALGPHCSKLIFPPSQVPSSVIPNLHMRAVSGH